ncbi:hypothetical protein ACH3Y9_29615 [Streptomyces sp. WSLK1-5]|uniref:hypothetical protein n=1 Tax=unclassified Streptomyces TaxID=2593676 RepID=UPI00379C45BD
MTGAGAFAPSLAVPLLPAGDPMGGLPRPDGPQAFTVTELVEQVRARLPATATRGAPDGAEADLAQSLAPLVVEDRIFASGTGIGTGTGIGDVAARNPVRR